MRRREPQLAQPLERPLALARPFALASRSLGRAGVELSGPQERLCRRAWPSAFDAIQCTLAVPARTLAALSSLGSSLQLALALALALLVALALALQVAA